MKMETSDRSILIFEEAIKSEETRKQYRYLLKKFVEYVKKEYPDVLKASDLLQLNDGYLQKQLEDYLIFCKKRIGHSTIKVRFSALELFFAMNDRILNFKKIKKMFPQKIKVLGGHPWTTSEIQKILESTTSLRSKAIIHLLSSTGCRIGALQNLRWEHVSQMPDNCRSVLFYEGSNDEYYGFLTPESSNALEEYFEERRKNGEYINLKSPLFRKDYRKLGISKAEPMNLQTYRTSLFSILSKVQTSKGENRRHDTPMFHGFRI
jgi:integrase